MKKHLIPYFLNSLAMLGIGLFAFFSARAKWVDITMRSDGGGVVCRIDNPYKAGTTEFIHAEYINQSLSKVHEIVRLQREAVSRSAIVLPMIAFGCIILVYSICLNKK